MTSMRRRPHRAQLTLSKHSTTWAGGTHVVAVSSLTKAAYAEVRIGDYQAELGIIDRRWAPPAAAAEPGGVVMHWHVDDLAGTLDRLLSLGAKEYQPITPHGEGFDTASVIDPFGNVLGIMYNPHYLEILAAKPA